MDDRKARYRDISDGLLRQRRNLLLISMLMPLFFLSGASIEKINILGTIINVSNPVILKYALVTLFAYFFLRYWQYYQEETYVKDMHREMRDYMYHLEYMYLLRKVRKKANFVEESVLSACFTDPRYNRSVRYTAIPEKEDKVLFLFRRECEFYIYPDDRGYPNKQEHIRQFHATLATEQQASWKPVDSSGGESGEPHFYREYLNYNIIRFNIYRLIGLSKYALNQSYFTDYQLPFLIALVSTIVTASAVLS
ncbi:hypothetical protein ACOMICROBIO_NCLOACGD_00293 [Vibrio sp. B1ASS3]|uniref:hypothetical protein n=1 Tax=Vibrio sp. B1ASS3 TaxID=2751176 RepID=UPI001ABAD3C0|nr:hypothetical protein [Vibrio sp. B1ASS3]CAD7798007.1 hypothetical protein ACOMICROBIO_NCLOACGD_00293 [Vibrio sp. B1ASS3]CAE6881435.1 hypothetical protein ACOMICROBIO_NCLOACGD_00293 [Vibrio sp. B1ASS3]